MQALSMIRYIYSSIKFGIFVLHQMRTDIKRIQGSWPTSRGEGWDCPSHQEDETSQSTSREQERGHFCWEQIRTQVSIRLYN